MIDLSAVQYLEINSPDFANQQFMVVSNERVDTGAGILRDPIMPLAGTILGLFGTDATFYLNGVSSYDPATGEVTTSAPTPVVTKVYPESYTLADRAAIPEILNGDIKVYAPGEDFGYTEVALIILQVRRSGHTTERIAA